MKVGDIKVEAIKLMFVNYSFNLSIDYLQTMIEDENYGSYIVNMDGSISRALDRIQNACVLPIKSRVIVDDELISSKYYSRFALSKIEDFYLLERVVAENDNGLYIGSADYQIEGDNLVLKKGFNYTVLYYPKIRTIDDSVSDESVIWIPDHIARLIPYYIKGDLYQEEEPSLASEARNLFEMALEDLKKPVLSNQTRIVKVL